MSTCVAALYAAAGGPPASGTPAQQLVEDWASGGAGSDGFAMVFEDAGGTDAPSIYVKDSGTPANDTDINLTDDFDAFNSFLTYTSPSPKIVRQSDGNLKYCAHNLCAYSNAFSTSAGWDLAATTLSTGQADPDGGSNAFKLVEDSSTAFHNINTSTTYKFAVVSGQQYRAAVKVKAAELTYVQLLFGAATMGVGYRNFNLSAGTVASGALFSGEIVDLGGGWYECAIIATATSSGTEELYIALTNDTDSTRALSYLGDGSSGLYIYQAQVSRWPADTTYLPTTTAARYALPIQHDSSNNAEGLLVEPAATNLVTYSNDFASYYSTTRTTFTADETGPDGVANSAVTCADNSSGGTNNVGFFNNAVTVSTSTTYTYWVIAKQDQLSWFYIYFESFTTPGNLSRAWFDLANGVVGSKTGDVSSSAIQAMPHGFYRCSVTFTTDVSDTVGTIGIRFADADNDLTVDVDGTSSIIFYHSQLETGSVPTSPIITTGATATRAVDDLNKALTAIEHSATAGTLYAKYVPRGVATSRDIVRLDDGTANEVISIGQTSGAAARLTVTDGGAAQTAPLTSGTVVAAADNKVAASWAANDFAISEGGAAASTDTSGTLPTVTTFDVGAVNGLVKEVLHLPEAMSDGDLASITT